MAGTTLLAYGIDVRAADRRDRPLDRVRQRRLRRRGGGIRSYPEAVTSTRRIVAIVIAILIGVAIGAFQGSIVALIGVPSFVVTLAGFQIWQGVILKSIPQGVILIQSDLINNTAGYFFGDTAGWIIAAIVEHRVYVGGSLTAPYRDAGTASPSGTRSCSGSSWSASR